MTCASSVAAVSATGTTGRLSSVVRDLTPGYFALVMASGIISVGMRQHDQIAPSVALLSVGEEAGKGREEVVEAGGLLDSSGGIDFRGNVEGRDLLEWWKLEENFQAWRDATNAVITDQEEAGLDIRAAEERTPVEAR